MRTAGWLRRRGELAATLVALASTGLQIAPLFWRRAFYFDWINHVWTVEYFTRHLVQRGVFPTTVDVAQGIGSPSPVFYGVFFYPLCALLGLLTGADAAVRVLCAVLLVAPTVSLAILFRSSTKEWSLSILLAAAASSSVYQLTNLYARSALTEFAAVQLLLLGLSLVFHGLTRESRWAGAALSLGVACGAMALGAHPITFYTFSLFVAPLVLVGLLSIRGSVVASRRIGAAVWTGCAALVLLPWIAITLRHRADLHITMANPAAGKLFWFPASIDSLWGRLGLLYVDPRVLVLGVDATSTPFLDAPFALALVPIVVVVLWRLVRRRELLRFVLPTVLALALLVYMAVTPRGATAGHWASAVFVAAEDGLLYRLLAPIQFVYRLAGTWSLCLTVALIVALAALGRSGVPAASTASVVAIWLGAGIALVGVGQRYYVTHFEYVQYPAHRMNDAQRPPPVDSDRVLLLTRQQYEGMVADVARYPPTFYGARDYSMPGAPSRTTPAPATGRQVVDVRVEGWGKRTPFDCDRPCLLRTNVVPSAFVQVQLDGKAPGDALVSDDGNLAFLAESGPHALQIDRKGTLVGWVAASVWAVLAWLLASVIALAGLGASAGLARTRSPDVEVRGSP